MEIALYNKSGHPVVYLSADDENSIYTWDGHAVAYIADDLIYGWRGKHLGWYINGILYDVFGYKVGSIKQKCCSPTSDESSKEAKYPQYARYTKYAIQGKPILRRSYSTEELIDFITQNKV
ncbi:MAG TPA: hypothetical protein VGK10_14485 [Prolixibacteraceae bacterium]|jgi:hypothetical protein